MKEIKYRFWHKKAECFVPWERAQDLFKGFKIAVRKNKLNINGDFDNFAISEEGKDYWYYRNIDIFNHSDFEPFAYTGEKDRNGQEIYEGDIIKPIHYVVPQEVMFLGGSFQIRSIPDNDDWELLSTFIFKTGFLVNQLEVLGNIYEDKELLK